MKISGLLIVTIVLAGCSNYRNDPINGATSPSGKRIAIASVHRSAGKDEWNTHVSIIDSKSHLPYTGNVFVADGLLPISVQWLNDRKLIISGPADVKPKKLEKSFEGIEVDYTSK